MTTRSGKPYKKPTMEEMQGMLKLLAEDRRRREDEIATEKARREDEFAKERARLEEERQIRERENRKQMETMQTHMAALMKLVEDSQKAKVVSPKRELSVKLVPLSDKDDIEAYLVTFERVMTAQKVEESCWSQYLAPQLTGKAQLAFAALPGEDSGNYEAIKTAILQRYDITEEAYRRRFRGITRGSGETNRELSVKLMDLLRKWMKSCTSMEEIQELIGMEQFLNTLPANKRLWVMERKPKTCIQAGELVDEYEHARREESQRYPENVKGTRSEQKCSFCGKAGHSEDVCYKKTTKEETSRRKTIVCYNCGKPGHPARKCPNNEVLFGRESKYKVKDGMYYIKLVVEGIPVTVEAAVADSLPVEVILGTDASRMTELLGRRAGSVFFAQEHVMVVTTRAKRRQEIQEEVLRKEKEVMSGVVPNPLGVSEEEPKLKTMSQEQRRQMRRELGSQGDCLSHINITAEKLKDMQEQDETLRAEVLMRIEKAGLTVKLSKSKFAKRSCEYLGYIVGGGVVKPILSKVEAISSFPKPDTKTAVRAFLGLAGYYRRFIPDFASVAAPLTDLTKKSVPNSGVWNEGCQRAFETLKKALISEPVLSSPDVSKTFIVQTDASDRGVGAVLSQVQEDGQEHPVGYYSRKLLAREQRYSTIEKECLAIKLALDAFKVYLLGRKFVVQTDHRALEWLEKLKENNARLCRWSLALQPYSFGVEHRTGTMNLNADALSRNPATALLQEKGKEV
eukprot:Em0018g871a